jgi:hypothetical protein
MTNQSKRSKKMLAGMSRKKKKVTSKHQDEPSLEAYVNDKGQLVLGMGDSKEMVCLPAKYTPWTPFEEKQVEGLISGKIFANSRYQVMQQEGVPMISDPSVGMTWLSIKRHDKDSCHDWRDFQRIKNELCGKERVGLELYPAESMLLDTSNQYHIWVLPEGVKSPFGFQERLVAGSVGDGIMSESYEGGAKQRSFEEEPDGCMTLEEFNAYEANQREELEKEEAGGSDGSVEGT